MENILKEKIKEAIKFLYNSDISDELATVSDTRKDFKGDFTLVVFPLLKYSKETPKKTATAIGEYLTINFKDVGGFNVIKGFLNLEISNNYWLENFGEIAKNDNIANGFLSENSQTILIEYSSPNTNKPLHLGHIRNNLL
jgi:arginyl-tRNA synthetase